METLTGTLSQRVDEVIRAHQVQPLRSTLGKQASIDELTRRYVGLEEAVREIALEVQKLAAPQQS
jgi:hypothetical protein